MFNSWRVFLQTTCAVALIAAASLVSAQDLKIGVVNPERLLRESTPARAALQKLETEFSKRQKDVEETGTRLKAQAERFEKDSPVMTETDRARRARSRAASRRSQRSRQRRGSFLRRGALRERSVSHVVLRVPLATGG